MHYFAKLDRGVDETITCFQKEKRKKCLFARLKNKRFPSIEAPPPFKETRLCEPEEHNKHALTVAIASAAAAEAALTAAQVAVEVVRFQSAYQCKGKPEGVKLVETKHNASQLTNNCNLEIEESSAIKIQTTFRGYIVSFVYTFTFHLYQLKPFFHSFPLLLNAQLFL